MTQSQIFLLLGALSITNALKIAMISDLHVNPWYDPNVGNISFCASPKDRVAPYPAEPDVYAPLGRLGCDPPIELTRRFLNRIAEHNSDIDILVIPGDFVRHSICEELNEDDDPSLYELIKDIHIQFGQMFNEYFPDKIILPTLGNNDYKYHYEPPFGDTKDDFLELLYT